MLLQISTYTSYENDITLHYNLQVHNLYYAWTCTLKNKGHAFGFDVVSKAMVLFYSYVFSFYKPLLSSKKD